MRINNEDLLCIDGVVVSGSLGADWTSKPVWLGHIIDYALQIVFTGTPSGSFKLQASCDLGEPNAAGEAQKYSTVVNWTDVADSTFSVSAAGNIMWDVQNAGHEWVRIVYTRSNSTGTITSARAKVKGV